jgi:hypothetical protein
MSFKTKTLKIEDHDVEVSCERVDEDQPCHRVRFTAKLGDTSYDHTMTIGPVDGPVIKLEPGQLQKDVDAARAQAANHAHFHHTVKTLIPGVD